LQIDTTFKDNNKRYPLTEITGTTNEMQTFLIAQALIPSESADKILWVFEQVYSTDEGFLIASSMKAYSREDFLPLLFLQMLPRHFR